jgi:hypothetical protein
LADFQARWLWYESRLAANLWQPVPVRRSEFPTLPSKFQTGNNAMTTTGPYRWNSTAFAEGYDQAAQIIHPRYLEIQDAILSLLP